MESISVIIPAYNEETTLTAVVAEVKHALADFKGPCEIIVVDDGSSDKTAEIAKSIEGVTLLRHEKNLGAGAALRTGLDASTCDLGVFVPADGQFDPHDLPAMAAAAEGADVVLGYRNHRNPYGILRKLQSAVFLSMVNLLFGQNFKDVNWVQMWRVKTAGAIRLQSTGVFMQQELIDRARRKGMKIVEVPVSFRKRAGGLAKGSSTATVLTTIREMFRYRFSR